jgi:hypothetical protein
MVLSVTGSVKMVRFSYSNEDTKDEEGRESWRPEMPLSRCHAPSLNHTSPLSAVANLSEWPIRHLAHLQVSRFDTHTTV